MATPATPQNTKPGNEAKQSAVVTAPAPPPVAKLVPTPVNQPPAAPPEASRQQKLAALCEQKFLRVKELVGANFSHEATCAKCGWHSMQHSSEDAYTIARGHVVQHWKDVVAFLA